MSTTLESPKTLDLALQLDADQRTSWLAHLFRPFSNEGMEDLLDWRFLGISTLKSSTFGIDEVSFFELSEPWKKQQDQPVKGESSTPSIATNSEDSLMMGSGQSTTTTRVRNTTAEHSSRTVVMSLDTQVFKPSKRQVYYLFPSDAIVEKMSETPPYELFCSFHALDALQKQQGNGMAEHPSGSSLDRQQCYTDFPSSPLLSDTTTPDVKMQHSVIKASLLTTHLSLSGISKELYLILKDSVSRFEVAYEKMVQLMKLHTQGLSHRCAELLLTDSHLVQPKKPKSELKISKGKRKGSYQQRLISPRTPLAIAPATPFVSSTCLSSKAKSIPSTPKRPSFSPPMATTTVSTPITPSAPPPPPPLPSTASSTSSPRQSSTLGRKCFYCGSKTTPMWRRGPDGAGTLCNACGVKWKHGKILCGQPIDGTPDQQKKRKQQVKLKKDKRIKMQQQKQHGSTQVEEDLQSNDDDEEEEDDDEDNFSYEEDNDDDDDDEEQMKHNIVAARHLTIHESPYTSASLDDSTEAYHQYDNGQHPYYEQRPRRHTADVSVLERGGPWVDYPLSMGVDAVEAATVLTLLKRSSQT